MTNETPNSDVPRLLAELLDRMKALEERVAALGGGWAAGAGQVPYIPPTEEELHDMLHGPRGQPILEVIEEYEKKYLSGPADVR
jgi:hypothetical protein